MSYKYDISATIVLYENDIKELNKTIECFLQIPLKKRLFLIDNSRINILEKEFNNSEVYYQFIGRNIGFGAANNMVIQHIKSNSKYHLILNSDVSFSIDVIPSLIKELQKDNNIAMIAPAVLYPDGRNQTSCRRYPSYRDLFIRRSNFLKRTFSSLYQKAEYKDKDLTKSFYPDFVHGCFMLFKTEDFVKIGGFDERYFLYMEDVDICKKIDKIEKRKIYYPKEQITHILKKESSKNPRLFFIHLMSSIKYFKKWGF